MEKRPKIMGIILAYNCAELLAGAYKKIPKELFDEIILVDDGSTDDTFAVAQKLGIRSFTHEHLGYGGNVKFGLRKALEAGADYMVEIHGDGQYDVAQATVAIEKMQRERIDFLLGSRFTSLGQARRDGMPLSRYLANLGLSFFDRLLLRLPLTEFHSGFRVYTRRLVEKAGLAGTSDTHLYSFQIIAQAGYHRLSVAEIPVRCDYNTEHTSISLGKSAIYAFQTFWVLFLYLLARIGLKNRLFP